MEYYITKTYLGIPVCAQQELKLVEIYCEEEKIFEFKIPMNEEKLNASIIDYYAYINVEKYKGKSIRIKDQLPKSWLEAIRQDNECHYEDTEEHPGIHFTAKKGWINDPNGLVFYEGEYHLYYQYNPFDTKWENMSWGHAVSQDLLHWTQLDTVLWPDHTGTMFSGSGIVNDRGCLDLPKDSLLFFYTAAGGYNQWSEGIAFTQRMAVSRDKGRTLEKVDFSLVDTIEKENRDPKVFWHEDSKAYIMTLWLTGNEFAILRSTNLEFWDLTQRLVLEEAWECPDLFQLSIDKDESKSRWVFWAADGFYFLGEFDGYIFHRTSERLLAYQTKLPYAAQSYSGINNRVISIPWLRTQNQGSNYTGIMGLPRELSLITTLEGERLSIAPVSEYETCKRVLYEQNRDMISKIRKEGLSETFSVKDLQSFELVLAFANGEDGSYYEINYDNEVFCIDRKNNKITYDNEEVVLPIMIMDCSIIIDREIIEITCNHNLIYMVFQRQSPLTEYKVTVSVSEQNLLEGMTAFVM